MPDEHYHFIDKLMTGNDELTAGDLMEHMEAEFGLLVYSKRTVAQARQDLGWSYAAARYCQAIREQNKMKRLAWCQDRLKEEKFDDVIFTDESTVVLEVHWRKSFRKRGQPRS
jgi:hypothetical protein